MDTPSNSVCGLCSKRFNTSYEIILCCSSCGVFTHKFCVVKKHKSKCCHSCDAVDTLLSEHDIDPSSQKYIDLLSLKKSPFRLGVLDYLRGLYRLPSLLCHFSVLYYNYLMHNFDPSVLVTFLNSVNKTLNINVKVLGMDKIRPANNATSMVCDHGKHRPEKKVIFVSNHVGFIDALILPRFFRSGVIASISASSTLFGSIFSHYAPTLVVERGSNKNTVQLMNRFLSQDARYASMYVFPQGMFAHVNSITRFRSGGFATRYPVQPIVTRYAQDVSSLSLLEMLCYPAVDVTVHVMDVVPREAAEDQDEDQDRGAENDEDPGGRHGEEAAARARLYAERVRRLMASHVSPPLLLSNVDSYDAVD